MRLHNPAVLAAAAATGVNPMVWVLIGLVVAMAILIVLMRLGSHRRRRAQKGAEAVSGPAVIDEAPPSGEREIYQAQPRPLFAGTNPSMGSALAPPPPPVESMPVHEAPAPIQTPGGGTTLTQPGVALPVQGDRFQTPGYEAPIAQQQFTPPPLAPAEAPAMAAFTPPPPAATPAPAPAPDAPSVAGRPQTPFMPAPDNAPADAGWTTLPEADVTAAPAAPFLPPPPAAVAAPPPLAPIPTASAPSAPIAPPAQAAPIAPPAQAAPSAPPAQAAPAAPATPVQAPLTPAVVAPPPSTPPAELPDAAPVAVPALTPNGTAPTGVDGRQTILLIEDDERIAKFYTILFEAKGFNVENARDGLEGVDMASSVRPALILLDVMMPKMNGLMVLQTLRANPDTEKTPVVVLSNYMEPPLIQRALQLGAIEYVVKSQARPEQLVNALPSWLKGEPALH